MKIRLAADLQTDSIVDGLGIRTVIWTQGCSHNCPGCHNPGTHDFKGGELVELEDVLDEIENLTNFLEYIKFIIAFITGIKTNNK